jgi:hypothetical protein
MGEDLKTIGEFEISAGETIPFVLTYGLSNEPPPRPVDAERALHNALTFWRQWSDQCALRAWRPARRFSNRATNCGWARV